MTVRAWSSWLVTATASRAGRWVRGLLVGACWIAGLAGSSVAAGTAQVSMRAPVSDVTIATATIGGSFYMQGAALAEVLFRSGYFNSATAQTTSGSLENIRLISRGGVTFAIAAANWIYAGHNGVRPFTEPVRSLRIAAPVQVGHLFFVTLADSPVRRIKDLRGRRVAVAARGSGNEQHVRTILGALGISFDDFRPAYLDFSQGAAALRQGTVDVQFQCCLPNGSLTELSELARIRVIPYLPEELDRILAEVPFYSRTVLERGAFRGHEMDTETPGVASALITSSEVDETTVYLVTKLLIEQHEALTRAAENYAAMRAFFELARRAGPRALEIAGVPLHPGAARAFQEAGILR